MRHKVKHIHFVGIGGSGMSGIAEVLHNLGYCISGSDLVSSAVTNRLLSLGMRIEFGHEKAHLGQADVLVVSSAVKEDNPEVLAARECHIPVVPRALMLAELMRLKRGIAIAGTHGKTTTTSLVASILAKGGLDPTFVIGGLLNSVGTHAMLGAGDFIVAEADESDASFLNLFPVIAAITNIDADHMETYGHDLGRLKAAFVEFTQRLPFYGRAIVCRDSALVSEILPAITKPLTTYGFHEESDVRAENARSEGFSMYFTVHQKGYPPLEICLNQPGLHNVQNACAAIAIAREIGVYDHASQTALAEFHGVGRRFTRHGEIKLAPCAQKRLRRFTLIDDYGHHPTELAATIAAARGAYPNKRLMLVFQPHRYSRVRDLFEDFVAVLSKMDVLLLTEVYGAGEAPIVAADGRALARAVRVAGKVEPVFVEKISELPEVILNLVEDGDIVMLMGAGSITTVVSAIKENSSKEA